MTGFPCSSQGCGNPDTELRQYGSTMRHGRIYPNWVHVCQPCHDLFETERNESRRT